MLGDALRLIRTFHDMSQRELARELDVSNSYLSEIESNKKQPSLDFVEKYSAIFGIPVSSIMFFSENYDKAKRSERVRSFVSKKILSMMDVVSSTASKNEIA